MKHVNTGGVCKEQRVVKHIIPGLQHRFLWPLAHNNDPAEPFRRTLRALGDLG